MAKLIKKNEEQFRTIITFAHRLVRAKHHNNRAEFEAVIAELTDYLNGEGEE